MVTLEEIRDKKFERAMFGGYAAEEVDTFLEAVQTAYAALEGENRELRSKMTVLADKVREYRVIEDGIKDTLLAAQKMSAKILEDTKEKCGKMLAEAETESSQRSRAIGAEAAEAEARLTAARGRNRVYAEKLILTFESYIGDIKRQFADELAIERERITAAPPEADEAANEERPAGQMAARPISPESAEPSFTPAEIEDAPRVPGKTGSPEEDEFDGIPLEIVAGLPERAQLLNEEDITFGFELPAKFQIKDTPKEIPAEEIEYIPPASRDDSPTAPDDEPDGSEAGWSETGDGIRMVEVTLGGDRNRERRQRREAETDVADVAPRAARQGIDIGSLQFGKNYEEKQEKDRNKY